MAQLKEKSFSAFLSSAPLLPELLEHIDVGTKWYFLGTLLHVDDKKLDGIEQLQGHDDTSKTLKMFQHWLTTTPTASRRQVLEALRKRVVNEHTVADKYEKYLKELHDTTYTPPSTEAVSILQRNIQSLNEALVSPVQVSQLLYCKRCISEATLNEMERIDQRRSLDDKKTTLLTAMQETVSSDYRKLKDIATVLSDVEQTRDIANEIMTKYEEKIPQEDDSTVVQPQEAVGGNEDRASDILRNNYSALSQSITEPVRVARLLHEEVISDEVLSCVKSTRGSVSDSRAVLLKAVRDAVHSNYKHLELFVTVLRKFSETAHIGDNIFEKYKALFPEGKMISELRCHLKVLDQSSSEEEISSASSVSVGGPVYFPLNKDPEFSSLRCKFGSAFYAARCAIEKKNINPGQMRMLLSDCFPHKQEFSNKYLETTNDILDIVKRNCNLIDINCLEVIVSHFNVSEAFDPLEAYKAEVEEFCKVLRDELNESLEVVRSPRPLSRETIVLVLDQTPLTCTVSDIKDVVRKASGAHIGDVRIMNVSDEHSIAITCFVPMSLTGSFIATVLQNIKHLQSKGLKELLLDNTIIWELNDEQKSSTENDVKTETKESELAHPKIEEVKIEEDKLIKDKSRDTIEELRKQLQTQYRISRMKGLEIEDLKAKLREKEDQFSNTEKELASLKELSETRLQEIEQLKLKLEDNNSKRLQVPVEETSETIKDESSDDDTSSNGDIVMKPDDKSLTVNLQVDGDVVWSQYGVILTSPSVDQCKEVISKLKEEHKSIILSGSSSESTQVLIPTVLERGTINYLAIYMHYFSLSRDDILSFSSQLSTNKSLTILRLTHGSMSDDGVIALAQSLQYNKTLRELDLVYNPGITSACAQSLTELLLTNSTLRVLHLDHTSIDADGVMILMESLKTNNTLRTLMLDKQHEETCSTLPYYEHIKGRLGFVE